MPKARKKTMKVTPKKGKPLMPKKVTPEKVNGKVLKSECVKSSVPLLLPVLMASSWSNFLSPKVMAMDVTTLPSLHSNHLFAIKKIFIDGANYCKDVHTFSVAMNQIFNDVANDCKEAFIGQLFYNQTQDKIFNIHDHFFDSITIFAKCKKI